MHIAVIDETKEEAFDATSKLIYVSKKKKWYHT